eukprot:TRINITY_DN27153_c0_g2_i1.p1 TRINITY_DN27153_c0_g2~~TRINITY_DN27153_c0_g2_i1.p1  ORF type:complete len:360 (+),score=47.52 TRINITY_DN27153_c0_g2_i1:77-1156(+)
MVAVQSSGADEPLDNASATFDDSESAASVAGTTRAVTTSWIRIAYQKVLKTLGRWAAAPHRLFRPENPTLGRFEDAIDAARRHGESSTRRVPTSSGGAETQLPLSRGFYSLYSLFGLRRAIALKCRSVAVNSVMGTLIFTTYDSVRGAGMAEEILADERTIDIGQIGFAAALAGSIHGAVCAPLDAAAHRIQALGPGSDSLSQEVWKALKRPLAGPRPGVLPGVLSGGLIPLSMARDGFGIASFFLSFETMQSSLHRALAGGRWKDDSLELRAAKVTATLTAGGTAGIAYRFVSWPWDLLLVKRLEAWEAGKPMGSLRANFSQIVEQRGIGRTFVPPVRALLSAAPSSALGLLVYEWLR